jgi:CelD/BcsL family acetyltransferase involved in cellulose biosynthesis
MGSLQQKDSAMPANTAGTIRRVSLQDLETVWQDTGSRLDWRCLFTLPPWLMSWWSAFGDGDAPHIVMIDRDGERIGVVPLKIQGATAELVGSPDVCDYLDIISMPGRRQDVTRLLLDHLGKSGIRRLFFNGVRKAAAIWTDIIPYAQEKGWAVSCEKEEVTYEIELPDTWQAFLQRLNGKQRHELRRKLRRLNEAGDVQFRMIAPSPGPGNELDRFIDLFTASRSDKRSFMTAQMAGFFRSLAESFDGRRILQFGELALSGQVVAMVMCFDYRSTRYLYNSGFDPRFRQLSVGLVSKILSIRDAVEQGISCFDFLKGAEIYKQRLGGVPKDIYRCSVHLP